MTTTIPKGSTVLVTGINGYIASHVADQLLLAGYKVRGTVRSISKGEAVKAALEARHPGANIPIVAVADMAQAGAFDEAVKGVSGIAHVASVVSFDEDPNNVIPEVIAGVKSILISAATEPSVKSFVYTSSSTAAVKPVSNKRFTVDSNSWNEEDIEAAHKPPPYDGRAFTVYSASKAEAEKAVWGFVKEQKPSFITNSILPNCNFGEIFVEGQASTGGFLKAIYEDYGKPIPDGFSWRTIPPRKQSVSLLKGFITDDILEWFVDVRDTARLHIAALIFPDVKNERIFAFAEPFNYDDIFKIIEEVRPGHKLPENTHNPEDRDLSEVSEKPRAEELLKRFGRSGFASLHDTVKEVIEAL